MGDFSFYMVIPAAAAIELGTIVERYRDRCRHCDVDVILKKYDFSIAYPLTSISYVLGIGLAVMLLQSVPLTRWLGVLLITAGWHTYCKMIL